MLIDTVNIQHYKSLNSVSVKLQPDITVIVGPNGVGKSNFVDVFRFLHDVHTSTLENAITKREGISRILQKYATKPKDITLHLSFSNKEQKTKSLTTEVEQYSLKIRKKGKVESGNWCKTLHLI